MTKNEIPEKIGKVVIGVYTHPDFYPPTINTIWCLSDYCDKIIVVNNNTAKEVSTYPSNVGFVPVGSFVPVNKKEKLSIVHKLWRWILFTIQFCWHSKNAELIIIYDYLPLLSYYFISPFLKYKKKVIWYHNHDVMERRLTRKFSISWLALILERNTLSKVHFFSLPAIERKSYFDTSLFQGQFYFLPNYPSLKLYNHLLSEGKEEQSYQLIFQGSICDGHGLEEICQLLPLVINKRPVKLILKGYLTSSYKDAIKLILERRDALGSIEFVGATPYEEVPKLTARCHLGIAIFTKTDVMNKTLGTASNKIYEYAACGVPILYYDSAHFRQYLSGYDWALDTNLTKESLLAKIEYALIYNDNLSYSAKQTFAENLHYEVFFAPLFGDICKSIN